MGNSLIGKRFYCDSPGKFSLKEEYWNEDLDVGEGTLLKVVKVGLCSSDYSRLFNGTAYKYPISLGHEIFAQRIERQNKERVCIFPLLPCKNCVNCYMQEYNLCRSYSYLGSRVNGGLSTYLRVPEWNIRTYPRDLNPFFIPMIEPLSVVIHAFQKLPEYANRIIITGSGFLSYLALKIAELKRFEIIRILSQSKINEEIFEGRFLQKNKVKEKSDFDSCLDFSGRSSSVDLVSELLEPKSTIVSIANSRIDTTLPSHCRDKILRKELVFRGSWNSTYGSAADDWSEAISSVKEFQTFDYPIKELGLSELPEYLKSINKAKQINSRIHVDCEN